MKPKVSSWLVLKITTFRNYLLGSFISEIGNQMQIVAVAWQVYDLTHNPASLGLIGFANFMPILLLSLVGGLVADKVDRKKLLIISQSALAVLALTLFGLTFTQTINPWVIYLVLILSAVANSFSLPARQAVLPNLVPKHYFMNAVSLHTIQFQSATMIGPAIAGVLIATLGVGSVYLINALSFIASIVAVLGIKKSLNDERKVEFHVNSILEGVRFVTKTPILYLTMILDFLATFFGTATILMPVFAKDILHVGPLGLGLLYSAPAVGGVIAGLILSSIHNIKNQGRVIIISVIVYGLATIGFGLSKYLPISLLFLALMGFGDMLSTIIRNTIRQMITPNHLRGRMASIMRLFFQGGPQLGEIEAGFLAAVIGAPAAVVLGGIGTILTTSFVALVSPKLRNYQGKKVDI